MRLPVLATLCLTALPALANDGFGGISATGLTFGQTDAVLMLTEDLFISLDEIKVDYTFENTSSADVTGEVIFPMPPIPVSVAKKMKPTRSSWPRLATSAPVSAKISTLA